MSMGNKLAWIIGGVVGGLLAVFILWLVLFPPPTPPTRATTGEGRLELKRPTEAVTLVLPAAPTGAGDAGADYNEALEKYRENRRAVNDILRRIREMNRGTYRPSQEDLRTLRAVYGPISNGAGKAKMTFYFLHTPKVIKPPYITEVKKQFLELQFVPIFLAAYHITLGAEHYPKAEKCLFDAFTMGWHLAEERSRMDVVRRGFGLQKAACVDLKHLYGAEVWNKPQRRAAVERYRRNVEIASGVYLDLDKEVFRNMRGRRGPHPGDVFNLAENHADVAVRRMGTLWLGIVKLTCSERGDKKYVRKLIARKLRSKDEIERECARAASELDQAGFNIVKRPP